MQNEQERWSDIEGYPNFNVSSEGYVVNLKTHNYRKPVRNQQGITMVHLADNNRRTSKSLAVLVAEIFVVGKTELFNTPIHLNGNRSDCRASNLMWRPLWFAREYHRQFGLREFHDATPAMECLETGEEFHSLWEPCTKYGLLMGNLKEALMTGGTVHFVGMHFYSID